MKRYLALVCLVLAFSFAFGGYASWSDSDVFKSIVDDEHGSVYIKASSESIYNNQPEVVIMDLMRKKAWWVESNSSKKIVSMLFVYNSSNHIYGLFIHYEY